MTTKRFPQFTSWIVVNRWVLAAIAMFGIVAASLATPAAAQTPSKSITKLPNAIYLPADSATRSIGAAPAADEQVRDMAKLSKSGDSLFKGVSGTAQLQARAKQFVNQNARELGLEGGATFDIRAIRETLTGRQIELQQKVNGIAILDNQITISLGAGDKIESVSKNITAVPVGKTAALTRAPKLTEAAAYDIAWQDLAVTGQVIEPPKIDKAYVNENNALSLVYVVTVAVTQPFGYWEYQIDSSTGRIVSKRDRRIKEAKTKREGDTVYPAPTDQQTRSIGGAPVSRDQAFTKYARSREAARTRSLTAPEKTATGKAMVFDMNPVTALANANLTDTDPPEKFAQAYVEVTLADITQADGRLHLRGPLVRIEDFEPGEGGVNRPPASAVAKWDARRGDNAFNDVMTYYYLHKSLTYLRTLGYAGTRDLFPAGLAADSDGDNGNDNSHYVPGSDRLAFGHGCVDDNEDTDVILHELGHAITYHLEPNWGGGDAGAVGEGFGDYWAISFRMRQKNGLAGDPGKVFVWDGIAACWPGRRVDKTTAQYTPGRTYGPHERVGDFVSDELWSTPLVGALTELVRGGETPESVDQVVLEGMAGIGRGFTMRTLAAATVNKAKLLFPGKPHAAVFEKHFKAHAILDPGSGAIVKR